MCRCPPWELLSVAGVLPTRFAPCGPWPVYHPTTYPSTHPTHPCLSRPQPAHVIGRDTSSCVMIPLAFSAGKRFFVTVLGLNLVQLVDTSSPLRWRVIQVGRGGCLHTGQGAQQCEVGRSMVSLAQWGPALHA